MSHYNNDDESEKWGHTTANDSYYPEEENIYHQENPLGTHNTVEDLSDKQDNFEDIQDRFHSIDVVNTPTQQLSVDALPEHSLGGGNTGEGVNPPPVSLDDESNGPVGNEENGAINAEEDTEALAERLQAMAAENTYPIPYRSKLTEPFEPGQTLIIKGKTAEDSARFTVNLHSNSADFSGNDVPLHISVRFDEGKLVYNTFSKGEWGKEERKSNPWKKGDEIDLRIRAHDSKFTIFADQKEIKEYEHRVPLSSITHFSIDGDVFISHIHWGGKYYPVPYESGIPGEGLAPGKTLLIFGTPEKKGKRFHINLLKKNGDIALHFNVRFDEKAIVRNSLISNEWGNEEREGKIPLEKAIGFDLKIINEEYAFQVFINEERFCTYAHRLEPHDLHGLQIGGDVEISGIQIF